MSNEVVRFLITEAEKLNLKIFNSVFGEIHLERSSHLIDQSSGSIYGIVAEADKPLIQNLNSLNNFSKLFPVYWGKDISPVSRLRAHTRNYKSVGNANLKSLKEIRGKRLIFGAIFIEKYFEFEKYLHNNYPPLISSLMKGRRSNIIKIIN